MRLEADLLIHTYKIKTKEVNCNNKNNVTEETFILILIVVLPQVTNSTAKFYFLLCS